MARPEGRPTKYDPALCVTVEKLAKLGLTNKEMADVLCVAPSTMKKWAAEHQEFSTSLARGRALADAEVASSLYERALGYSHPAEKIMQNEGVVVRAKYTEHYPPDTQAAMFILRNRQPKYWKAAPDSDGTPDAAPPQKVVIEIQDGRRTPA